MDPILEENRKLLNERCLVRETVIAGESVKIERVLIEGKASNRFKFAVVGEANAMNQNQRVYPASEWQKQIDRATKEKIPNGTLIGAVDHQGCAEGGTLKSSPIMWRSLDWAQPSAESAGGSRLVGGEFEVLKDHSAGKDLLALMDAGYTPGFSTVGYAKAREPSDEERKTYGIAEDNKRAVIIEDWELVKIDAVDNPSVRQARQQKKNSESAGQPAIEGEIVIKTLAELQAQYKDLLESNKVQIVTVDAWTAAEKAVNDNKDLTAKVTDLESKVKDLGESKTKYDGLVKKLSDSLSCLADEHGAQRPYKEVTAKEADEKIQKLEADLKAANDAKAGIEKTAKEATDKLAAIEADKADKARQEAVATKVAELVKGTNKYAKALTKVATEAAAKDKAITAENVKTFVDAKIAEYDALESKSEGEPKPNFDIEGVVGEDAEGGDSDGALKSAEALAEAL